VSNYLNRERAELLVSALAVAMVETCCSLMYCIFKAKIRENTLAHNACFRCTQLPIDIALLSWTLVFFLVFFVTLLALKIAKNSPANEKAIQFVLVIALLIFVPWSSLLIDIATRGLRLDR
jgi:uncharacterized oligopeptide transporter (OPT) family protein